MTSAVGHSWRVAINAPDNSDLDSKTFYIDYLDENRATIVDPDTLAEYILDILGIWE